MLSACVLAIGCNNKGDATGVTTGTANTPPSTAVAPAGSKPAPGASKGNVTVEGKVPADADKACQVKFTGKQSSDDGKPEYSITNGSSVTILSAAIKAWAYDASGKQTGIGGVIQTDITVKPGQTWIVDNGGMWFKTPVKATDTLEAECHGVGFEGGGEWSDRSLSPEQRPKGGKK